MRALIPVASRISLLSLPLILGLACRQPSETNPPAPTSGPGSDERAIRDAETRWREMLRRKDTAAIGSFYTEDAIYAPEDRPPARGRDAVAAMWATNELTLGDAHLYLKRAWLLDRTFGSADDHALALASLSE